MALNLRAHQACGCAAPSRRVASVPHVIYLNEQTRGTCIGRGMMPVHHFTGLDCQRVVHLRFRPMQAPRFGRPGQVDGFLIGIPELDIPYIAVGKFVETTAMLADLNAVVDGVWPPCAPTLRT